MTWTNSRARLMLAGAGAATAFALALGGCSTADDKPETAAPSAGTATELNAIDFVYAKGPEDNDLTELQAAAGEDPTDRDAFPYADIAECFGKEVDFPSSSASGPALQGPEGVYSIISYAHVVTPEQLKRHTALLGEGDLTGCLMSTMGEDAADDGLSSVDTWTSRDTPLPPGALARLSFVMPSEEGGATVEYYSDIVFLGTGRVEAELIVMSMGNPVDDVVENATARYVAQLKLQ
ncbi:hypothetical protein I6A84_21995 [Frankia sp. CNm7]|uniref:Lipoprotein n=1 Tax=Frankia nepalensis TaxID=1836974 RepID=A0A937RGG8_9ACTN|nr:hypothetical protein [Frankia nepalensis]MBL7501335.1 hypothetical protein [Frankia nepalensis]MBL7509878.1 hypothetical protein [Frankia nepalensis]MBL7520683.1 hypothetical protein [Frankia nepalensis]MBL7629637.1 hypothetical protein [Frankia nepalensis]